MKKLIPLMLVVILSIILTACGSASPTPTEVNGTTAPIVETGVAPSDSANPYPGLDAMPDLVSPYPAPAGYEQAQFIYWTDAEKLVLDGSVSALVVTANNEVYLKMTDGVVIWSNNVRVDLVDKLLQSCGDACSSIAVTRP